MPYNPQVQPHGDMYLFRAISGAGDDIGRAIQEYGQRKEESKFLDSQVETMAKAAKPLMDSGKLDPSLVEELAKFPELSLSQKRGKAAGFLFSINQATQAAEREQADRRDRANLELNRGRFVIEAQRENRVAGEEARLADYNRRAADYYGTPELLRQPAEEVGPRLAAEAGVATPSLIGEITKNDFRRQELGIRDRAVAVQEANLMRNRDKAEKPTPAKPKSATEIKILNELYNMRSGIASSLAEAEAQLAKGNQKPGPDWAWGTKYADVVSEARTRLDELDRRIASLGGASEAAPAPKPSSHGEVQRMDSAEGDPEVAAAFDAIQRGADPLAVERRYRERTGKGLPW